MYCSLGKKLAFAKNALQMMSLSLFNFGILALFVCSLISHLIFKQELFEIYIELFYG